MEFLLLQAGIMQKINAQQTLNDNGNEGFTSLECSEEKNLLSLKPT